MNKLVLSLVIVGASACSSTQAAGGGSDAKGKGEQPALVFLLAGQSQIAGHAQGELPEEYRGQPANVLFFETGEFRKLGPRDYDSGAVLRKGNKGVGCFGPEISFGHEIAKAFPDRTIILVKHTGGGGLGHPSIGWNAKLSGQSFDKLLEAYATATKDRKTELAGMIWSQGSGDSSSESMAKAYAGNLKLFIQRLRKDLKAPELPIFFGDFPSVDAVPEEVLKGHPHYKLLTAANAEVSRELSAMYSVNRLGLSTLGEGDSHYDLKGTLEFGRRFAKAYLEHVKAKAGADGKTR